MADLDAVAKELGAVLKDARARAGLTRGEVTSKLQAELGENALFYYETARRDFTVRRLVDLAEALGVSPVVLLQETMRRVNDTTCQTCGRG